jgi:hypothetical protein
MDGTSSARKSVEDLIREGAMALGPAFTPLESRRELHVTPGGTVRPFTWVALRRH